MKRECILNHISVMRNSHLWPQVALKVIKHCQEEGSSSELVSGFLVGLVVGTTLEITNCFPLPKDLDDGEEESMSVSSSSTKLSHKPKGQPSHCLLR